MGNYEEFLNMFENKCIKYVTKRSSNEVSEVIVLISKNQLLDVLDFILSKEIDDFFMYVMNDGVTWEYFLANRRDLCYENKIYNLVNLSMDVSLSEYEMFLSYNTTIYNDKNTIENLKRELTVE